MPVYANIAGAQKEVNDWYSNIGGVSKKLNSFLSNINGTSVELLVPSRPFWRLSSSGNGTLASNTRKRMVSDSVTVSSDGTFTLISATSISGIPAQGKFFVSISTSSNSSATTGSTLYYATNGSGAYRNFNIRGGVILSSSSFPSAVKSSSSDVFYELNGSQHNLYISKDLIPSLYRWTQYNVTTSYTDKFTAESSSENIPESEYYHNSTKLRYSSDGSKYYFNYFSWQISPGDYLPKNGNLEYDTQARRVETIVDNPFRRVIFDGYYTRTSTESRGSATGRYGFSTLSNAFPSNGKQSGYWYDNRTTIT